jgi:hypothetical protein
MTSRSVFWYETAFFLFLQHPNVMLDALSIPPKKLLDVLPRIPEAADHIPWGTDWPPREVVSMRRNFEERGTERLLAAGPFTPGLAVRRWAQSLLPKARARQSLPALGHPGLPTTSWHRK